MSITTVKNKRGTAAEWASANPILADGELGFERDTNVVKIGDGVKRWNQLKPINSGASVTPAQTITYNGDGTVHTVTVGGVTLTYTYNTDGTIATESDGTTTRAFTYTNGSPTAVA